jgi:hypothetical protein
VRDALERTARAAVHVGVRGVIVNPISANALAFYEHLGFTRCRADGRLALITLADAAAAGPASAGQDAGR